MKAIFDFSNIEKCEEAIKKTWSEFCDALAYGIFTYKEVDKAKQCKFLKAYDELFSQSSGNKHETVTIKKLKSRTIGRGTILGDKEVPNYERFIPKKEFIKEENRFSPPGVEWLYLAMGSEDNIHQCAQAECRAKDGQRFGFCHFKFQDQYEDLKLVDLTIADNKSYSELNKMLVDYEHDQLKKGIMRAIKIGFVPDTPCNPNKFRQLLIRWVTFTYAKLLSEQIFVPLSGTDDKSITYAPFQTMAQYYISLGYSGIVYGSTVCDDGKNIVLFNKYIAHPVGTIEDYVIS